MEKAQHPATMVGQEPLEFEVDHYQDWFDVMRSWFSIADQTDPSVR